MKVLETLPHDPHSFTQGLEMAGAVLYESTGLVGQSTVQAGPPGAAPAVRATLPQPLFGEGITVVGAKLWQLTWRDGIAIERDGVTLAELRRVPYRGEGWGVCYQSGRDRLVMSNGSARLTFRDRNSFAEIGGATVSAAGHPVAQLNELECVGDTVYANVWLTDRIVRIDSETGAVTGVVDASGLLPAVERGHAGPLNGIAGIPGTRQFILTGKLWPKEFRVEFVADLNAPR
ncbi:glutaminyl-peptide cyclotransferase [Streptomyces melanogenes]|nr:glutaminyl-peptide cyclotransferase [Streptomyces melanogenes]